MKKHLKKKFSIGQMLKLGFIIFLVWCIHTTGYNRAVSRRKVKTRNRAAYQVQSSRDKWLAKRHYSLPRLILSQIRDSIND